PLILAGRRERASPVRQVGEDRARLRQLPAGMLQHWGLAHLVDALAPLGIAGCTLEEVHENRLPVEAAAREIERDLVGVPGLAETVQIVLGHGVPCLVIVAACKLPWLARRGTAECGMTIASAIGPSCAYRFWHEATIGASSGHLRHFRRRR